MKTILTLNGSPVISPVTANVDYSSTSAINTHLFEDGLKVSLEDHQVVKAPYSEEMRYVVVGKILEKYGKNKQICYQRLIEFDLLKLK